MPIISITKIEMRGLRQVQSRLRTDVAPCRKESPRDILKPLRKTFHGAKSLSESEAEIRRRVLAIVHSN
jgi:hypothetical protein